MRAGGHWVVLLSGALLGAGACRLDAPAGGERIVQTPAVLSTSGAGLLRAGAAVEPPQPMPGPYRGRLGAAVALNATCVSCHTHEAEEWRASRHREAYSSAAFQEALRIEPIAFCRGCHAPESDPASAPSQPVADLGVGCVTCHVAEEGVVLGAASSAADSSAGASPAPHPVRRSLAFARTGGCAACHEFRSLVAPRHDDDDGNFMQTTVREHQRSPAAETACAACHMPVVSGRRSHAFASSRDPAWLADRLRATATHTEGGRVRVTLVQASPGHGFPTGDLFRRLEVGCELRDDGGKVVSRDVKYLARRFAIVPGTPGRQLVADDRVLRRAEGRGDGPRPRIEAARRRRLLVGDLPARRHRRHGDRPERRPDRVRGPAAYRSFPMGWMTMRFSLLVSSCLLATACRDLPRPAPIPEPAPPVIAPGATVAPRPSPSQSPAAPPARTIPTLTEEELAPGGAHPSAVFAIDGAVLVVDGQRIGRIVGDGIEWLTKTIPTPPLDGLGPIRVFGMYGRWPNSIGVGYMRENGRMPAARYFPLTGVGLEWGNLNGFLVGAAQVGESTVAVGSVIWDDNYKTVRGTAKRTPMTKKEAHCKEDDDRPALDAHAVAATRAGTMVTIGEPCSGRGPAAEVWDTHGKSRLVDLGRFWSGSWGATLLQGEGDELWLMSDPWRTVLRFREGAFEAVPELGRPIANLFASPRGVLHASDGRTVYRLDASGWTPVAILPPGGTYEQMVMDDQDTIWASSKTVRRLRPGPAAAPPSGCATPFVYLYVASYTNGTTYTYPATRKALSSFPEVGALGLVEVDDGRRRRLGVTVTSAAQGEALIAHLHQTMKNEDPRLTCFSVANAKEVRNIALR